jgi:hypothetical protein
MKKYSTYRYRRVVPRRSRKPLTCREIRAFMSVADRAPLCLDLKAIAALIDEQE